jgi:hypothetical protein
MTPGVALPWFLAATLLGIALPCTTACSATAQNAAPETNSRELRRSLINNDDEVTRGSDGAGRTSMPSGHRERDHHDKRR